MQAINCTRQQMLIEKGIVARTATERRRGLLGRASLTPGEGLLLPGTKSVHTFGMRFPIDVVFLDSEGCVIHLVEKLTHSRVSPMVWRSAMVLEMPAARLAQTGTELGDRIELIDGAEDPGAQLAKEDTRRSTSAGAS